MMPQARLLVFFGLLSFAASCTPDRQRSKGKRGNGGERRATQAAVAPQSRRSVASDVSGGARQQDSPPEEARSLRPLAESSCTRATPEAIVARILYQIRAARWQDARRTLAALRSLGPEGYRRAMELGLDKKIRVGSALWRARRRFYSKYCKKPGSVVRLLEEDEDYQRFRDEEGFRKLRGYAEKRDQTEGEAGSAERDASNTRVQSDAAVEDTDDADAREENNVE